MAANDRGLSKARTEVTCWNTDRRYWDFRGTKGYGISRNYFHRAERRYGKKLCNATPMVEVTVRRLWGETVYVHNISDVNDWQGASGR